MEPLRPTRSLCLCLAVLACLAPAAAEVDEAVRLFDAFKAAHQRAYDSASEHDYRFSVFQEFLEEAQALEHAHDGAATFGVTQFADQTPEERQARLMEPGTHHLGRVSAAQCRPLGTNLTCQVAPPATSLPSNFDWRTSGRVTAVKNQAGCGGCWAFSAVEVTESVVSITHRSPPAELSVQQTLSCSMNASIYVNPCNGSSIAVAMDYAWDTGLIPGAADPFACSDGCQRGTFPKCPSPLPPQRAKLTGTCECPYSSSEEETLMRAAIFKVEICTGAGYGPVAVRVDAYPWFSYTGGVIQHHCSPSVDSSNHAVVVTGWGTDTTTVPPVNYWSIRNSWGPKWGEAGYLRVARGSNVCGVANEVHYGTI